MNFHSFTPRRPYENTQNGRVQTRLVECRKLRRLMLALLLVAGCTDREPVAEVKVLPTSREFAAAVLDTARGEALWAAQCASCHTGKKGWDLAHFAYADTTIIRRARSDTGSVWPIAMSRCLVQRCPRAIA